MQIKTRVKNVSLSISALLVSGLLGAAAQAAETADSKVLAGFTNESRVGIVSTTGNSKSQTLDLSQKNSYEQNANKASLLATYLRSKSKSVVSARRWTLGLRYDRILADRWSLFLAETIEGDTFAGYLQRYNSDIGGKYFIAKSALDLWIVEAGYRHQHENQTTGNSKNSSFARFYSEYEHRWNPSVSTKLWLEYLQNLSTGNDRFFNSEASVKAALTDIFSIQLAYLVKYRHLPPAGIAFKTDTTLTAALLAQF